MAKASISGSPGRGESLFGFSAHTHQAQIPISPASFLVNSTKSHTGAGVRVLTLIMSKTWRWVPPIWKSGRTWGFHGCWNGVDAHKTNFRLLICLVFLRKGALKDAYGIDKMSLKVWRQCKNMWVLIVSSRHILNVTMTRTTREAPFKEKEMTHELKWRYRETRVREQGPLSSRKELGNIWSLGWTSLTLISDHSGNNNTQSVCFTKIPISSSSLD